MAAASLAGPADSPAADGPASVRLDAAGGEPAVEARGLGFRYGRGAHARAVLEGIEVDVPRGGALAVVGPSGSGKSTLLRLLAGLVRPAEGQVTLRLPHAAPAPSHLRAGRVGYIPQHLGLVRSRGVLDNVLAGALARTPPWRALVGDFLPGDVAAAERALAEVGLAAKAGAKVHHLSGGERQRVAIARALVQRPALLCADEFVSNLDVGNAEAVLALVDQLRREGVAVVMALHDLDLALAHADRILVLRGGRAVALRATRGLTLEEARWLLGA